MLTFIIDDGANEQTKRLLVLTLLVLFAAFDNGLTSTTVSLPPAHRLLEPFLGGQLNGLKRRFRNLMCNRCNIPKLLTLKALHLQQLGSGVEAAGAARFSSTLGVTGAATFADSVDAQGVTSTTISGSGVLKCRCC